MLCCDPKENALGFQATEIHLKALHIQEGWTRCQQRCLFQIRNSGWNLELQNTRACVGHILCAAAADKQDEKCDNVL
jgi:hypothetical protein